MSAPERAAKLSKALAFRAATSEWVVVGLSSPLCVQQAIPRGDLLCASREKLKRTKSDTSGTSRQLAGESKMLQRRTLPLI